MAGIDFALGFIAGEATFTLNTKKSGKNGKIYVRPAFKIGLDERDIGSLLEVREIFGGIGEIYEKDHAKRGVVTWVVQSEEDLSKLCDIIEEQGSGAWYATEKYEQFKTWSDIVDIYAGGASDDKDRVNMVATAKQGGLNVGAGRQEKDYQRILDWYAENRNVYPDVGAN